MRSSDRPRFFLASVTAPLPALLVVAGLCVAFIWFPELREDDPVDDAPVRAAGVVLMLSPLLHLVTAALCLGISKALAALLILSRRNLLAQAAAGSIGIGAKMAFSRPFGPQDALVTLALVGVLAFVLQATVVLTWWKVARYGSAGAQRTAKVRELP